MKSRIIFDLIILGFLACLIVMSLGYQYDAKVFPLLIAIPSAILLALSIIGDIRRKPEPKDAPQHKPEAEGTLGELEFIKKAVLWLGALIFVPYMIGFALGIPLFTLLYMKFHNQSWRSSIIMALVLVAVIYGGFDIGLKAEIYKGLIFM